MHGLGMGEAISGLLLAVLAMRVRIVDLTSRLCILKVAPDHHQHLHEHATLPLGSWKGMTYFGIIRRSASMCHCCALDGTDMKELRASRVSMQVNYCAAANAALKLPLRLFALLQPRLPVSPIFPILAFYFPFACHNMGPSLM